MIGSTFCAQYADQLEDRFVGYGEYGVAVPGGVETMAAATMLGFQEGCTVQSFDGTNAGNSLTRAAILPAVATYVPNAYT